MFASALCRHRPWWYLSRGLTPPPRPLRWPSGSSSSTLCPNGCGSPPTQTTPLAPCSTPKSSSAPVASKWVRRHHQPAPPSAANCSSMPSASSSGASPAAPALGSPPRLFPASGRIVGFRPYSTRLGLSVIPRMPHWFACTILASGFGLATVVLEFSLQGWITVLPPCSCRLEVWCAWSDTTLW